MASSRQKILNEALDLSPIERALLIEELLASFNFKNRKEIDKRWGEEAENRIKAFEAGEIKSKSFNDVLKSI